MKHFFKIFLLFLQAWPIFSMVNTDGISITFPHKENEIALQQIANVIVRGVNKNEYVKFVILPQYEAGMRADGKIKDSHQLYVEVFDKAYVIDSQTEEECLEAKIAFCCNEQNNRGCQNRQPTTIRLRAIISDKPDGEKEASTRTKFSGEFNLVSPSVPYVKNKSRFDEEKNKNQSSNKRKKKMLTITINCNFRQQTKTVPPPPKGYQIGENSFYEFPRNSSKSIANPSHILGKTFSKPQPLGYPGGADFHQNWHSYSYIPVDIENANGEENNTSISLGNTPNNSNIDDDKKVIVILDDDDDEVAQYTKDENAIEKNTMEIIVENHANEALPKDLKNLIHIDQSKNYIFPF